MDSTGTLSTTTVDLLAVYDDDFKDNFSNPTSEISQMMSKVNEAYSPSDIGVSLHNNRYYYDSTLDKVLMAMG